MIIIYDHHFVTIVDYHKHQSARNINYHLCLVQNHFRILSLDDRKFVTPLKFDSNKTILSLKQIYNITSGTNINT